MMADPDTFGDRVNPCGCRGVPEGVHLPDCPEYETTARAIAETNVLEDANHAIERNHSSYGHPLDDARRFATIARAATGLPIEAEHFPRIMLAVKLARLAASPFHRDSLTDVAGYARAAEMMADKATGETPAQLEDVATGFPPVDTAESVQADAEQEPSPGVAGDDPPYGSLAETPEGFEYGPRTWEESE